MKNDMETGFTMIYIRFGMWIVCRSLPNAKKVLGGLQKQCLRQELLLYFHRWTLGNHADLDAYSIPNAFLGHNSEQRAPSIAGKSTRAVYLLFSEILNFMASKNTGTPITPI